MNAVMQGNAVKRGNATYRFKTADQAAAMWRLWNGQELAALAAKKPVQQDLELGPLFCAPKPAKEVA